LLQVIHFTVFADKLRWGETLSSPDLGLTRLCRNGFPLRRGECGQDGATNLSRFDHILNRFRQPGDFSDTAHTFGLIFFGRTGSNWAGQPCLPLQITATDCDAVRPAVAATAMARQACLAEGWQKDGWGRKMKFS